MSESLTTQQGKYMYTLCIQKALSPFFKKNILFHCKLRTETLGNPGFIHSAEI